MKVGLISLGCPKNLVDSEVMLGLADQAGYELTQDTASADVLVVNTCAFIDAAKRESIDAILEMAQYKKTGGCSRLIVTGCLAERYRDQLRDEIPEIDAVLGTGEVPEIVRAISGHDPSELKVDLTGGSSGAAGALPLTFFRQPQSAAPLASVASPIAESPDHLLRSPHPLPSYLYDADTPRIFATPRHYAYLKIAEGCDYKCAFCIIPTLRGAYRSRTAGSILNEARALAARGIKELMLISQDTTFYGVDRGERGALARLLRDLNAVDGLEWIRLLYLYPTTIDDATLAAMAECEKVCNYIDLPLQHAADPVLKRMKRPGSHRSYARLLDRIRDRVPDVAFRTTFIVGFPGETEEHVDELARFVRDQRFEHVGVFTYSHEEGTSAHALPEDVTAARKRARRHRIMSLQRQLIKKRNRARVGQRTRIMVDGPSEDHDLVLRGRLSTQAPDIDAAVYLTECDPSAYSSGTLVEVEIVDATGYDLIARPAGNSVL